MQTVVQLNVLFIYIYIYIYIIYIYIYNIFIRGGMVHVFVPNSHGTDISVRCMKLYNKYRQFTPNPEGGARSLITASRRTANAMSCALENKAP